MKKTNRAKGKKIKRSLHKWDNVGELKVIEKNTGCYKLRFFPSNEVIMKCLFGETDDNSPHTPTEIDKKSKQ